MINKEAVIEAIKTIYDPEIPVNIFELGLIYDIQVNESEVHIVMTLTTATCPAAAFMPEEVKSVVNEIPGVQQVQVDVVYEPRWTRDKMSSDAKKALGFS
jgi:FeS assembly SUF system protein